MNEFFNTLQFLHFIYTPPIFHFNLSCISLILSPAPIIFILHLHHLTRASCVGHDGVTDPTLLSSEVSFSTALFFFTHPLQKLSHTRPHITIALCFNKKKLKQYTLSLFLVPILFYYSIAYCLILINS